MYKLPINDITMKEEKTFWKICAHMSSIVTILGIISIVAMIFNYKEEQKESDVNDMIVDAISIFNAASDTIDYKEVFHLFLKVKNLRPNNLTGYNLFLELAKKTNEIIRNNNDSVYKYDVIVERYLQYADSLNCRSKNEAKSLLNQLQKLKCNE